MRFGKWARLLLLGVPLLAGCKGFWNPVSSSTTTTTTTTLSSGYFFILDTTTSQLISYDIVSGTLTQVAYYAVESTPITMAVAPNGYFLYVSTTSGIYVYTISSGVLTQGNPSSAITSDLATAMRVDSSDSWLVESSGTGTLNAIPINSTTGALSSSYPEQQVALSATAVNQLVFSANNAYVFAALGPSGTEEFSFKSSSSTPLSTSATASIGLKGSSALSVAVDPSDRLVYVGETAATSGSNSGGLRAFSLNVSTGVLSEISVSPLSSGGLGPYSILPKSTGDYVYVANWTGQSSSGNIAAFEITASGFSYSLTKLSSTAATGIRPMSLAEDSTGDFVLAACSGCSPYFDAYIFDSTTAGQLDTTLTSSSYAATSVVAVP